MSEIQVTKETCTPTAKDAKDALEFALWHSANRTEVPLIQDFSPGIYIRTINIPKNCTFTTELHKTEHFFVILEGEYLVWTDEGEPEHIVAPCMDRTIPGTRRVVQTLTPVKWMTIHANPTNETDEDKLREMIIETERINPYF